MAVRRRARPSLLASAVTVGLVAAGCAGLPDSSFGGGGVADGSWSRLVEDLGLHRDAVVTLGGDWEISRFVAGQPDPGFRGGGTFREDFGDVPGFEPDSAYELEVLFDGSFVVAGTTSDDAGDRWPSVAAYRPDGTLDPSFGDGGVVRLPVDSRGSVEGLAVDHSAIVPRVVVGVVDSEFDVDPRRASLVRLTHDGELDVWFGDGGVVDVGSAEFGHMSALEVAPNGAIFVAEATFSDLAVSKWTTVGAPDPSFGFQGEAYVDVPGTFFFDALLELDDGRVVVAAPTGFDETLEAYATRFTAAGDVDPTFGGGDPVRIEGLPVADVARQPTGKLVLVGSEYPFDENPRGRIVRLNADGSVDPAFAEDGLERAYPEWEAVLPLAVEVMDDSRIVVGGSYLGPFGFPEPLLARLYGLP